MHVSKLESFNSRHTQQGFVLIVALILLLVLTILGLAAAQSTSLEERMAGNYRNNTLAFQAAEAGIRAAESCLLAGTSACSGFTADANGVYLFSPAAPPPPSTATTPLWNVAGFWTTAGNTLSYTAASSVNFPNVASQPQIIIEQMPPVAQPGGNIGTQQYGGGAPGIQLYRITALGTGGDNSANVMLQAIFQP